MVMPEPVADTPDKRLPRFAIAAVPAPEPVQAWSNKAEVRDLDFYYGAHQVLRGVNLSFPANRITSILGPSGCGKSTLLRCFNRMHDLYPGARAEGEIRLAPSHQNILARDVEPIEMRMRIGMVFQKPNPFPKTVFENVAFGMRLRGVTNRSELGDRVVSALRKAALWEECHDRLHTPAYALSGGQQQRLCIARALATNPEMLLFDEPTASLDPISTLRIEDLMHGLKDTVTIILVTHNIQQAARVSDFTAFMYQGSLVEVARTEVLFQNPTHALTEQYLRGSFG